MQKKQFYTLLLLMVLSLSAQAKESFNLNWKFHLVSDTLNYNKNLSNIALDDSSWEAIALPHNAHNEPILVNDQWQGICWYRKHFNVESYSVNKKYIIEFEAAMNHTVIWINGQQVKESQGGYLPIVFDATPYLKAKDNVIAVRLDNRDNAVTGPKPLAILDFNMYGGLYRNAWFITKNKTHITHPILAKRASSGGVFITTPKVSKEESVVKIQTHVANEVAEAKELKVSYKIFNNEQLVSNYTSKVKDIDAYGNIEFTDNIAIKDAKLWSPKEPNLYTAEVTLLSGDKVLDSQKTRFGIREVTFKNNQLYVNGEKTYLRGVNRHQEYPFIGYALSDNAQYREAVKIKEAGFDYIRLSHYPQSPAFMEACDELGLFVADAILGWQYYNETDAFKNHSYESARKLIRRDRNHPCVLAWEVSLNETKMPIPFMTILHNIVHEEYPGKNVYSCGWLPDVYDIYFQARQHRLGHPDKMTFNKPYMVSEYGDWEYYSNNAGLNQHKHSREKRIELSSRQLRKNGEAALVQQAYNLQESHNDNMNIPATGDSYWVMFDYNRGYHNDIESSGIMDIFRLPKFGYYFYASQSSSKPVVKIASYWNENSNPTVKVFSNCSEVKLYLNNKLIASQAPDKDSNCTNLNHPPFTFNVGKFKAGELRADGYINGKKVESHKVATPGKPVALKCWIDESTVTPKHGCKDVLFLYIAAVDRKGTICPDFTLPIEVTTDSKVKILNTDGIKTEAGIATALIEIGDISGECSVKATSEKLSGTGEFVIE